MQEVQKIRVNKYSLEPNEIYGGTSGSFGNIALEFEFSDEWKGLDKKVVFHPMRGSPVEIVLLGHGKVDIPHEVTAFSGISHYVVNGFKIDKDKKLQNIITLSGNIKIDATYKAKGSNTKQVSVDNFEKLVGAVQDEIDKALTEAKESGEFDGKDGITPHVGANGNWFVGSTDTGISAKGIKGDSGKDGNNGINGTDGVTPHIGNNGNWFIGNTDTGISSKGEKGEPGKNGNDGRDGYSGVYVSDNSISTPPENANVWVITSTSGENNYIFIPDNLRYVNSRLQLMCGDEAVGEPIIITDGVSGGGVNGITFTPSVSEDGIISWTNDGGLSNPKSVNIKGEKGEQGTQGLPGKDGTNGKDGVSVKSIAQTTSSTADGGTNVITATLTNGTATTFNIKNGSKGSNGKDGTNGTDGADGVGITSVVQTTTSHDDDGTNIITVTLSNGKSSTFQIKNGSKGSSGTSASITVDTALSDTSVNPVQNKVIKEYIDKFKAKKVTANIGTTWTGSSVPYSQSLNVLGVNADSIVDISLSPDATAEQAKAYTALNLQDGGQSSKKITLLSYGTVNTISIPINIIIRGEP